MNRSRIWLSIASILVLVLAACTSGTGDPTASEDGGNGGATGSPAASEDGGNGGETASVRLQLQWVPQAQFAGYYAAQEQGYYAEENLDVEIVPGGPDVIPQQVGSAEDGPEFTISWVPKVLEAENPDTGELYQPEDLNVIDYNDVGTAMLQDAIFARESWLSEEGNEDVAVRFLRASFRGWMFCRDNPEECVQYVTDAGSTLGAGHQAWMMNEINPLIWPSPDGIGILDQEQWQQTVDISVESGIIPDAPDDSAFRTDLAESAHEGIEDDATGDDFEKGTVEVTPGGE